jgi:RimJ/RimL family protein N-acetyltransferase
MVELKTNDIYLRNVVPEDAHLLFNYLKQKSDNPFSDFKYPFTIDDSIKMFEKMMLANPQKYYGQIICQSSSQLPTGFISLRIDSKNKNAEIGLWIALPFRNKGYGQSAVKLITDFGFNNLNLNLIYCNIDSDNLKSINLFKKCGYIKEVELKERHLVDGQFKDSIIFTKFNRN